MEKTIGKKIRQRRKELRRSAEWLASEVGCSQSTISQYERDVRNPSAEMLVKIAHALDCRVNDLASETELQKMREASTFVSKALGSFRRFLTCQPPINLDELYEDDLYDIAEKHNADEDMKDLAFFYAYYDKLNDLGKQRILEIMEAFCEVSKYRRDDNSEDSL